MLGGVSCWSRPVVEAGAATRRLYLPALGGRGRWFDFETGQAHASGQWHKVAAPLEDLPLFAREGAAIGCAQSAPGSSARRPGGRDQALLSPAARARSRADAMRRREEDEHGARANASSTPRACSIMGHHRHRRWRKKGTGRLSRRNCLIAWRSDFDSWGAACHAGWM